MCAAKRILIVKTSSLGDVIQSFPVLDDLKMRFPDAEIDWAIDSSFSPIVSAHPLVFEAIPLNLREKKNLWSALKQLRKKKYDFIFDLQGNCKSGLITLFARGEVKVGFGLKTVREWPNILATNLRFDISKRQNIGHFYVELIERTFGEKSDTEMKSKFRISDEEREKVAKIVTLGPAPRMMICPGSHWANKQLRSDTWIQFLKKIEAHYRPTFFLVWGTEEEKKECQTIVKSLQRAFLLDKLPVPTWQYLMSELDLVISVDSSALHLCATTKTATFSIFGPTSAQIFQPIGERHFSFQGGCPYGQTFEKQCPILRSCPTGACVRNIRAEELFAVFQSRCDFLRP